MDRLPAPVAASEKTEPVQALEEPARPKNLGFHFLYGLANATIGLANITLYTLLLPGKLAQKDFGLINTAIFLPMLIAPAIAGIALSLFQSYAVLFSVIGFGTMLAAILIVPVKAVR